MFTTTNLPAALYSCGSPAKGSDLSTLTQGQLNAIANTLNDRPRRILQYQTPREVFVQWLELEQTT